MRSIYIFIFLLLSCLFVNGQQRCGSELNLTEIQLNEPERYQRIQLIEQQINQYSKIYDENHGQLHLIIPVVVHVLHNGEPVGSGLNISLAQIQSQIDVLNEDFRRLNPDRHQTPTAFSGVAADVGIEFVLACLDPNGNSTTGIIRRQTNKVEFNQGLNDIKFANQGGSSAWPTDRYLNMWVGGRIESANGQELLGYAQFPDQLITNPETDGVVIRTKSFGRTGNVLAPFHKGRTATHEVGHWLNLRHIWGDTTCGNDFVDDTPVQQQQNYGCQTHPKTSCGSNDMFMNYMDYSDDACMNIFTAGQAARMLALFSPGGVRSSFVNCQYYTSHCKAPSSISGTSLLCTANRTYSIQNLPPNSTVNWSRGGHITYVSGQGTANYTVKANSSTVRGDGWIQATITGPCGSFTLPRKNIWVGPPDQAHKYDLYVQSHQGKSSITLAAEALYIFEMEAVKGANNYDWQLPPGFSFMSGISQNSNYTKIWTPRQGGNYTLKVYPSGLCGSSGTGYQSLRIHIPGGSTGGPGNPNCPNPPCAIPIPLTVYPNPGSSQVSISFSDSIYENHLREGYDVRVYNQFQKQVFQTHSRSRAWTIDTDKFPNGLYIITISYREGVLRERLIIE